MVPAGTHDVVRHLEVATEFGDVGSLAQDRRFDGLWAGIGRELLGKLAVNPGAWLRLGGGIDPHFLSKNERA